MTIYRSKTTLAVEAIREKILNGEVARGERFDVRALAAELGMSITPVREALRVLQTDGLVNYDEHRAISAMTLSPDDANELYVFRSMVESFATELACNRWTEEAQQRVERLHEQLIRAADLDDIEAATRLNEEWHFSIYRVAATRFIEPVITRLWSQYAWNAIWSVPDRLAQSIAEHRAILTALHARDAAEARRLMQHHIDSGAEAVRRHGDVST